MLMGDDRGGVKAIINAMRTQRDEEELQASCCLALAKAALRVEEAGMIITVGGVADVVDAMLRFCGQNAEIQSSGCLTLARLARHGPNAQRAVLSSGGVDAVIMAMSAHMDHVEVQQWGCTALGAVALGNREGRAAVGSAGGVQAATRALQQHQGSEAVACLGCYALSSAAEDCAENKAAAGACGAVGACVAALKRFPAVRNAQRWAAHAISKIVAGAPANAQTFSALGGVDAIVGAMRAHAADSRRIFSACCDALGKAALGCPEVAKAVQACGGLELIMEGMRRFCTNAGVLESALWSLGDMSYNSPEVAMTLGTTGGIEAVLDSVLDFHKSQAIQRAGIYALGNIASGTANKKRIGAAGGIEATVLGMNAFPEVVPIQESGLLLLLHVCTGEEENVQRAYEAGAVKTVLGILSSCKGNAKIENNSCILLSELSHCSADVQIAIGSANGIKMIFSIMSRYSSGASVQQQTGEASAGSGGSNSEERGAAGVGRQTRVKILDSCLYALGNIAQRNVNNQLLIGKQGIAQVCAVMRGALGHPELQEKGALVLGAMTSNGVKDIQDMVRDAGGIHTLLCAMREYPENVELQCNCCMALSNVMFHNAANQNAVGGGLDAVVDALRRFPENEAVQEYGCFALGSILEGNEGNIAAFCRRREAFGAVVDAMRTHQYSQRILARCCYTLTTCGKASARIAAAASASSTAAAAVAAGGGAGSGSKETARYAQLVDAAVQRTVDCVNNYSDNEDIQAYGTQALARILRAGGFELRATFARASGVEVILSVMEYNANDPEILYWCSIALGCATDSVVESRQRIEACDGVRVILGTMFAYPQNTKMQLVCCKLLTNVAIGASRSIAGLGSGVSGGAKNAAKSKANQALMSSSSSLSLSTSCSSFSSLSLRMEGLSSALLDDVQPTDHSAARREDAQNRKEGEKEGEEALSVRVARCTTIGAGGGVDAVLGAMRNNPGDKEVQRCGCRALSAFAADNGRIRKLIGARGGVAAVLDALVHFQDQRGIVQSALEILASITTDTTANVALVREAHGLCLLLDVARRYSSVEAVQFLACLVLGNLAVDRTNQAALGSNGAVGVAIAALNSFQRVANVQGVGCFALARLADESVDNQKLLSAGGGVSCALAALKDFPQDRKVQKWALCTLYNATRDVQARAGAATKRGVELALAALRRYRSEVCVQKWALYVLGRLAAGSEACRVRIGEALGVDSVLEGMRAHSECEKVQCAGCYALANVVLTRANQARVRTLGGIGTVVHAMTAFPTDANLQYYACLAIGRAVFGSAENAAAATAAAATAAATAVAAAAAGPSRAAAAKTGALDAIVTCMNNHSAVPEIQASGCFAFFAILSSNVARPANLQALDTFFLQDFTHNGKRREMRALLLTDVRASPALQKAFAARGGVAAVIRALKAQPENAATQEFGCGALGCYALGNAAIHDSSASASCIEVAMSALGRGVRMEDRALQACATFAVCSVVDNSPRDSLALGERDDMGVFSDILSSVYDGDSDRRGQHTAATAACNSSSSRRDMGVEDDEDDEDGDDRGWGNNALGLSITEFCCRILANVSASNGTESQALVGSAKNIRLFVRAIRRHFPAMGTSADATRISLLNSALIAFGCAVFNNKANQDAAAAALAEAGCADIVLRIMGAACTTRNFRMIGNCCHALAGFCMGNAACKRSVVQCGGIEAVLRAMGLAKTRQGQFAGTKVGALQAVLSVSSRGSSISNYDDDDDDGSGGGGIPEEQKLKRNRSFDVITQSAGDKGRRREGDSEAEALQLAQGWAVKFLGIMSDRSRENTERICENGGVGLTAGVMHAYSASEEVQVNGCFTLANLGACGTERLKTPMLEAGVLEGVLAALRAHDGSKKVLRYGCFALSNIAQNDARCKRRICAIGGIEAVARVMRAQAEDEDIQRCCCFAMCNVITSDNPASQERAVSCGGVELLLACMGRFPENADIQSICCRALGNIALRNERTRSAVGASECTLRAILGALKRFPDDDLVQEHGCYALLSVMRRGSGGVLQTVPVEPTLRASAEGLCRRGRTASPLSAVSRADLADIARTVTAAVQCYQLGHPMLVNLGFGVFCALFKEDASLADINVLFGVMKTRSGDEATVAKAALLTLSQFCTSTVAALVAAPPDALGATAPADVRAQCVETAVTSMQKHPANVSIQSSGCLVLALCEIWAYLQDGKGNACAAQIRDIGGVRAVVEALRRHAKVKAVLVNGGMVLAGISYHDRAGQAACVDPGAGVCAVETVLELMGRLLPDAEIQRVACIVLKNVTKPLSQDGHGEDDDDGDDGGERGGEGEASQVLLDEGLCSRIAGAVEDTLLAHKRSLSLQTLGVTVLQNMSQMGSANVRACSLRRGRELVLSLMERFPDSPDAQGVVCKALASMGMTQQEAERVLAAVTRFAACESVQAHGCHALFEHLSAGDTDAALVRGSVAAAMAAMEKFPASLRVQLAGCRILTATNRRGGNGERAISLADAVLRRFSGRRTAVESALAVIANSVVYRQDISTVGPAIIHDIYGVMERHAAAASVLELCYTILTKATFQNDLNVSVFEAVGGVPFLARTLSAFSASATTAATAAARPAATSLLCWAVNLLGNIAGKCQDSVRESGVIELLVAVMRGNPTHDLIQGNGCYALAGIADGNAANKRSIAAAGGAEAVVAALRGEYPDASGLYIRQWGCSALAALSWGSAELAALVGATGGIEAAMAAMAQSPYDRQVQLCGARIFENAAVPECPENVARMLGAGGDGAEEGATAIDLICRAMETFRNDVQVQIRCLNALKTLSPAAPEPCEACVLEHVGTALTVHLRNTSVVFCGCCVLENMSLRDEPWPGRMACCASTVMRVLEKYIASNSIQRKCLETLNRVAKAAPLSVSPEAVVDSMERHANNVAVLASGFALLELTRAALQRRTLARAIETLLRMSGDFGPEAVEALLCGCRVAATAFAHYGSEPVDAALVTSAAKLFSNTLIVLCGSQDSASQPQPQPPAAAAAAAAAEAVRPIYAALCGLAARYYSSVVQEKATGAIALSVKSADGDVELKAAGCAALGEIAAHRSAEDPCLAEELRVLAEVLEAHPASAELQTSACAAIRALVEGDPAARGLVPEGAVPVLVARTGEGWDAAVAAAAFSALTAVVRDSPRAQEQALMCGGVEAAASVAADEGASAPALVAGLAFLAALASGNANAQAAARRRGVLAALRAAAERHSDEPDVLEGCILAFLSVSGTSRPELRGFAEDEGAVRGLGEALKRWAQQGRFAVVGAGLDLLGAAYEAGCGEPLARAGVPELALSLLLTTADVAACARCLEFAARMARQCPRSADSFLGAGGLSAVMDALAAHSKAGRRAGGAAGALPLRDEEELRAAGAAAVGALALFSQERALEICTGGGLEFLKALMRESPKSLPVQEQGALALSYVLSDDVVHKKYCMETGAIAQVAGALRVHKSSQVIEGSLYALKRLVLEQNKKWDREKAVPQYVFYLDPATVLCEACWKRYRDTHPEKEFSVFFLPWKCDGCK